MKLINEKLIERMRNLMKEKAETEKNLAALKKKFEGTGYKQWLKTGVDQEPDPEIEKAEKRLRYLNGYEIQLSKEIRETRIGERQRRIRKEERTLKKISAERASIYKKFQEKEKELQALQEESRKLSEERLLLEQKLNVLKQPRVEKFFKLHELDSFLEKNFILREASLQKTVEEARKKNRTLLEKAGTNGNIIKSYKVLLDLDSGEILKLEPFTVSVLALRTHKNLIKEVT